MYNKNSCRYCGTIFDQTVTDKHLCYCIRNPYKESDQIYESTAVYCQTCHLFYSPQDSHNINAHKFCADSSLEVTKKPSVATSAEKQKLSQASEIKTKHYINGLFDICAAIYTVYKACKYMGANVYLSKFVTDQLLLTGQMIHIEPVVKNFVINSVLEKFRNEGRDITSNELYEIKKGMEQTSDISLYIPSANPASTSAAAGPTQPTSPVKFSSPTPSSPLGQFRKIPASSVSTPTRPAQPTSPLRFSSPPRSLLLGQFPTNTLSPSVFIPRTQIWPSSPLPPLDPLPNVPSPSIPASATPIQFSPPPLRPLSPGRSSAASVSQGNKLSPQQATKLIETFALYVNTCYPIWRAELKKNPNAPFFPNNEWPQELSLDIYIFLNSMNERSPFYTDKISGLFMDAYRRLLTSDPSLSYQVPLEFMKIPYTLPPIR